MRSLISSILAGCNKKGRDEVGGDNERVEADEIYNIMLDVARQEYLLRIEAIKNIDEKINKYLVAISIVFAASITVFSSDLNKSLKFTSQYDWIFVLSFICCFLVIIGFYYAYKTFRFLLNGLGLVDTRRMPDAIESITKLVEMNSTEFKYQIIDLYKKCIDEFNKVLPTKQQHLKSAAESVIKCTIFFILSIITLISLTVIANNMSDDNKPKTPYGSQVVPNSPSAKTPYGASANNGVSAKAPYGSLVSLNIGRPDLQLTVESYGPEPMIAMDGASVPLNETKKLDK